MSVTGERVRLRERLGRRAGPLAAVALVVTWSSGFVGAELAHRAGAAPLTVLGWRFALLAVLLLTVAAVLRKPLPTSWRAWGRQTLLAVLSQVGYLFLVFEGVTQGVHGGTTSLIAALQPLLVATVAGRLLGERSTPLMWLGMLLGLGGVALAVSGDLQQTGTPLWAYALPTAGMLCLAIGTVLTRRLDPPEDLFPTITMQAVITGVILFVAAAFAGQVAPPAGGLFWVAVGWLLALASLGGYVMYVFVNRTQGATVVSTLLYLTPPTTMLWVFLMFGEPISVLGLVGLAVSAVGVVLVLRSRPAVRGSS
ncbi:EamA family transporter [Nakamurella sp. YIM 132087]|uniref:EamA family transporter n=1 Tax=Nakamurella alba TaxID=2665158 RepID=A0A7K1FLL1_9ACTN|nr:DMT family transporter [Nakamurella alba]MTD15032.1 EamA family transporter [Nakamurella alba]